MTRVNEKEQNTKKPCCEQRCNATQRTDHIRTTTLEWSVVKTMDGGGVCVWGGGRGGGAGGVN